MALIDDVKQICDRLGPLGWRDLLAAVTANGLDIAQPTTAKLRTALTAALPTLNRTLPGFEDLHPKANSGIAPGQPAQSLLYHALASPRVLRDGAGAVLRGHPTLTELETVESFVFGIQPPTLAALVHATGVAKLAVVVFATEYRPAPDTADDDYADLVFARTGIARIGTARPKYVPEVRGYWPEDENNPHGFRVIPARFSAWLAAPIKGTKARVMKPRATDANENARTFWIPVHKLFEGPECLAWLTLSFKCSAQFFNMKLQRVHASLGGAAPPAGFPFVITDGLADLVQASEFGRIAVVPNVHTSLVQPAIVSGKPLTYTVPKGTAGGFATYTTDTPMRDGREIHRFPAYVHARTKVTNGNFIDLNDDPAVNTIVNKGGYDALHYVDFTGEGWLSTEVPELVGKAGIDKTQRPAYVLLSAPDFFPATGQRELSLWSRSNDIPKSFRTQLWAIPPTPLSEERLPANLQLPASPFDAKDDTMTAVVGMGSHPVLPSAAASADIARASALPDDAAGVFAPGWDVAVDVLGPIKTGTMHLAAYGLGSPFAEDAKLCAALSTFWPAVAPDVYRSMLAANTAAFHGTVAPLTDEEIGQIGALPLDGVAGPQIVQANGQDLVEIASFENVDYVTNAVENRFSGRLTSRITGEQYERRVLSAARVHWVLSGGANVEKTRSQWLILSFRSIAAGDPELQQAQTQAGHVFKNGAYRVEACFIGTTVATTVSPRGARFRRLPLLRHSFLFVAADDNRALLRRATDPIWSHVAAE